MTGNTRVLPRRGAGGRVRAASGWALAVSIALAVGLGIPTASTDPAPDAAPSGRIEGTVTLGDALSAKRASFDLYAALPSSAPEPAPAPPGEEYRNVVVYLERAPEGARPSPPNAPARVAQERLSFTPHVLPIVQGTTVEFPNQDTLYHNVFSLSKVASFDLGRYPRGESRSVTFSKPGIVKVFCHIHSNMSAVIVVLDNPHFATPDTDGRYVLEGIPAGEYRVVAWHERARRSVKTIRVTPGGVAKLDFVIPLSEETPADG